MTAFAWAMGLYFAFQPMVLPGFPSLVTAGSLEWVSAILAIGASTRCLWLLFQATRSRGIAWWAYAIGSVAVSGTALVLIFAIYAALQGAG
jgi:hypothetical protein